MGRSGGPPSPEALRPRLMAWYGAQRRDLPWRRTKDPYAVWVSEVMLQQTRVEVVREAYQRFLDRFPDPASLARASDDELLAAWAGLGYYHRARRLREAARLVWGRHGGKVPADPEAFGRLPGVGPYTAGAVLSIAHGQPLPALDGNVERVLCRLLMVEENPRGARVRRSLLETLRAWIPAADPGGFNQALMELGALICKPAAPRCGSCPLAEHCRAFLSGADPSALPALPPRRAATLVSTEAALVRREGLVLGAQRAPGQVNAGHLDLPGLGLPVPVEGPDGTTGPLERALARWARGRPDLSEVVLVVLHTITHHRIEVAVRLAGGRPLEPLEGARFADPRDPSVPWSTVARKVFRWLSGEARAGAPSGGG